MVRSFSIGSAQTGSSSGGTVVFLPAHFRFHAASRAWPFLRLRCSSSVLQATGGGQPTHRAESERSCGGATQVLLQKPDDARGTTLTSRGSQAAIASLAVEIFHA